MNPLRSKYKLSYFLKLFFFSTIVLLCYIGYSEFDDDSKLKRRLIFIGIVFLFLVFFILYRLFIRIPVITIDDKGIKFSWFLRDNKVIEWPEISEIDITSAKGNEEGVMIGLKQGNSIFISSGDYQNMPLLREFLSRHCFNKEPMIIHSLTDMGITRKYAGNPWFSVNSVFIYVLPLLLAVGLFSGKEGFSLIISGLILFPTGYFFYGWRMFWFKLSGQNLVVRNHYWFWYKKVYRLQDIETFVYERDTRGASAALRIICKDFSSKGFQAGSLRREHWQQLREQMVRSNIKFINGNLI